MRRVVLVVLVAVLAAGLLWLACGQEPTGVTAPSREQEPAAKPVGSPVGLEKAMAVQDEHTPGLLAIEGVVGTATGLGPDGAPVIAVLTRGPGVVGLPTELDGVPAVVKVTGRIRALKGPPPGKGPGSKDEIDPKSWFPRPVPIGVSTGNEGECSAGTIGARVKDAGGSVYVLSNNHVYALENTAPVGSKVLQPGLYDTDCVLGPENVIGALSDYEPLRFDGSENVIDAAIALSSTDELDNATPDDGYGTPKSATTEAAIGQKVQKYGRSTGLTRGTVTLANVTLWVGYSSGTALFVDQIIVEARKPLIKRGDSGSLLVTSDRSPVGLLFAGNESGKLAVANPIGPVLTRFGAAVDGE